MRAARFPSTSITMSLGLAFATLVESLDQLGANPPAAAMEHLRAANERMDSPPDGHDAWERLRAGLGNRGLPSKSTSASWMLVFLMPLEVRRSFIVPPGAITAGETSLGTLRIRTRWRLADHRKLSGSGQIQPHVLQGLFQHRWRRAASGVAVLAPATHTRIERAPPHRTRTRRRSPGGVAHS